MNFLEKRLFARGSFGKVYFAKNDKGEKIVIKKIKNDNLRKREIETLVKIGFHFNIVKFLGTTEKNEIIMQYTGIDLAKYIKKQIYISEELVLNIEKSIKNALEFIHSKGYVHRDIKPQNITLKTTSLIYLIDFGLARKTGTPSPGFVGTLRFASVNTHDGGKYEENDDYESLIFVLEHLRSYGKLVWNEAVNNKNFEEVKKLKIDFLKKTPRKNLIN